VGVGPYDARIQAEHPITALQDRVDLDLGDVRRPRRDLGKLGSSLCRRRRVHRLTASGSQQQGRSP